MVMPVTKGGFVRLFFSINGHISQTLTWKFIWWWFFLCKIVDIENYRCVYIHVYISILRGVRVWCLTSHVAISLLGEVVVI